MAMGCPDYSAYHPRAHIHLSIPDFDIGMQPGSVRVRPDIDLEAIILTIVPAGDDPFEVIISPDAGVGLILGLTEALGYLIDGAQS
jgi:hypothetical protein